MRRPVLILLALAALGPLGCAEKKAPPPDPQALVEQLKSTDEAVSGKASLALLQLGEPSVAALVPLLQDPDPRLRALAATTLWGLGPHAAPAVAALTAALADPEARVRGTAAMALEGIGPGAASAVPALTIAVRDPDAQVKQRAIKALGAIGPAAASAMPELLKAARIEDTRPPAEEAIRRITGR
jgi:HEAT repeat protein